MENKKALLVVSFGTSFDDTREKTIDAIENDLQKAFPDRAFYRAWTSKKICKKLASRGVVYDSVAEAARRMASDGVTDVLVQPTYMIPGMEYVWMLEDLVKGPKFESVTVGKPLLCDEADVADLAAAMERTYPDVKDDEMLVWMGHGSEKREFPAYELLDAQFAKDGYPQFCIGTVEFLPGFEPVQARVKERAPKKVYLAPLMIVAGDHANNDMAGDEPDSWKNLIGAMGPETECFLRGMGEYPAVRAMFIEHAKKAKAL